jgi:tetratricopeptide (TPR) repeat protein
MKRMSYRFLVLIMFAVFVLSPLFCGNASAQTCNPWIAKAVSVEGSIQARRAGETQWRPVKMWDEFCPGDMVRLLDESRAAIVLVNGVILRLDENTTITFKGMEKEVSLIEILKGVLNSFSRWPRSLEIFTPFVNGTVEGTEFLVKVDDKSTLISVFEGHVKASNKAGSIALTDGQSARAKAGKAPVSEIVVHPRDAVQWALYYPPVIYTHPEKFKKDDPRLYTYHASSLLHVGRVDEAKAEIRRALKIDPKNSQAFALEAIIAVTQNEKEKALSLGKKAVKANPHSASALVALSYAQQASFDLEGALSSLEKAVKVEPDNALVWSRLAEMHMSFGELDRALKAAEKAVELNPDVARTQTVLGFAYLTEVKIKQSKEVFEKAIELDKASPLPRLGLGLAKIREGCLVEGRKEIEIAVSLDPDNSLMRSYLGKAFYEEKREKMADDQYGMAEKLDPKDPTPYFYDAIKKQSINRPVEALEDMQKAIDLNDDRAVYRSKLLLDADLAARSASLARIYTDLGFQDLALVEGWQSVNTDPADFSGHRFLADSYSALPRHEIARVSELLQSQLLQPININPVQPHLAESNLFILEGAGPSEPSFNEFNPLFNRNRLALQLSGVAGGNSTFGDEVVASAIYDKFSISAGQFHYETDGFRENNDLKEDIYNLFAQYELSPKTSVQAEYRHKNVNEGDLSFLFNPDAFDPNYRDKEESDSVRFGIHHSLSPNSDILMSASYAPSSADIYGGVLKLDQTGYGVEVQHLYRMEHAKLIAGAGYFGEHDKSQIIGTPSASGDVDHTNLYLYAHILYPQQVTWILGGSGDFFKSGLENLKENQFNPKFGLIWNPFPTTTIRGAIFRTLKRAFVNNQTLEPTQVAGFNQFFDDGNGIGAWRYGIGLDQKITGALYAGGEFSKRDLTIPSTTDLLSGAMAPEEKSHERLARAYVNWAPHPWLALREEYLYEQFKRPEQVSEDRIFRLETHRLLFGINFFHPTGLFAKLQPTYVYQHGRFFQFPSGNVEPGSDHFWVFDASVGFRLPKRFGIFSIEAKNLFNEKFNFQDTDPSNPTILPKRLILAKLTLSF